MRCVVVIVVDVLHTVMRTTFRTLPLASIGRCRCDVVLCLEDHSGGMDESTRVLHASDRDQAERCSSETCGWCALLDLSDSSSANVPLTCERCGDSARHLSCVYGGQWKRAFRVNTRVVLIAVSHGPVRSATGLCRSVLHVHSYLPCVFALRYWYSEDVWDCIVELFCSVCCWPLSWNGKLIFTVMHRYYRYSVACIYH